LFYRNCGKFGRAICYVTGFFGTPIHELSHALFCLLFGHKITEIKLFQVGKDGTLGYVNHSYNQKNLYQKIGNFFIGIAPLITMSCLLILILYLLLPDLGTTLLSLTKETSLSFSVLWTMIKTFFASCTQGKWWLFLLIGFVLSLHMNMSIADMKNSFVGLFLFVILFLFVNVILRIVSLQVMNQVYNAIVYFNLLVILLLFFSFMINLLFTILSCISLLFRKK
jgi:hypothetical protein